jgi:exodeoxyribonuclease-3
LPRRFDERSVSRVPSSAIARSTSATTPPRKVSARAQAARGGPQQILKIASFNVNNVNRRLTNLLAWIGRSKPDVVSLQELKCTDDAFPAATLHGAGYDAVWRGQRTHNGVAILTKTNEPVMTRDRVPGDPADDQCRYVEAAVQGFLVASIYLPKGNPQPGPKFDYKLAWFERLIAHATNLYRVDAPVVLEGDFNVVPTDKDIYPSRPWSKDALLQPESRACFRRLLDQGWTDAVRIRHPDEPVHVLGLQKRSVAA